MSDGEKPNERFPGEKAVEDEKAVSPATLDEDFSCEGSDGGASSSARERRQRGQPATTRRMSPLDIHFSQMRARGEFRDGRSLEKAISLIRPVRQVEEGAEGTFFLEAPFPPIEVLQWRCKLRDEQTGRPRIDPKTGGELYDSQDRWFTLDNRRLYCLQKAAAALWPATVTADVAELQPDSHGLRTRARQLKKFRTLDRGRSVFIGGRGEGEALERWSWHEAAGAAAEADPEPDASNCRVQMRRRPRREHHLSGEAPPMPGASPPSSGRQQPRGGAGAPRRWERAMGASSTPSDSLSPATWKNIVLLVLVYTFVRLVMKVISATMDRSTRG